MKRNVFVLIGLMMTMLLPAISQSSGTYLSRHPKPPKESSKLDHEKYNLGKSIFNGQTQLNAQESEPHQSIMLADIREQLPERLKDDFQPSAYAGKLDEDQLDALDYYVMKRFKTDGSISRYNSGYAVVTGRALPDTENAQTAAVQSEILQELQTLLPDAMKASVNLPSLAGKLSVEQLDAVSYYVSVQKRMAIR